MIDEKRIYNYIRALINPYGKPFEGTTYELGLKIMKYIEEMEKVKYPLSDCVGDCKNCWKTKLVNDKGDGNSWIPCSERLPSENGKYLATGIKGSVYIAEFSKGVINGKPVSLWCRSGGHYCNVIAWMELPPAYEGE